MTTETTTTTTTATPAETPATPPTEQPDDTAADTTPEENPQAEEQQPEPNPNREAAKYRVRLRETEEERDELKRTVKNLQLIALGSVLVKGEYKAATGAQEAIIEELGNYDCWDADKLDYAEMTEALGSIQERKPYLFDYNQVKNRKYAIEKAIEEYPVIKQQLFDHGICPCEDDEEIAEWCKKFSSYVHNWLPDREDIENAKRRNASQAMKGYNLALRNVNRMGNSNSVAQAIRESTSKH
ncbi:hypothetical protein [Bifidobacterium tibiigranuli]|jgi:hypothetical protein|uniref:hypothetical protein n=1 Tax=Bifidobacterium tibiigranuli TaxID=2172043 RepID=UPI0026EBB637|nr:hypothetical protein [Bifidobacterium tibiigranuli]MCI2185197.1 hypothetical protein [Bifidobacterium tibiigranuli]MCI2203238.1 hypothetical protein [Bifidobacterium tibiigranuli]